MKNWKYKQGFTLIELLVVIGVIAVLAAILFPVFARAREKARQSSCINNMKQIATGFMMYGSDHDEVTPPELWYLGSGQYSTTLIFWMDLLTPYIKNQQVYVCPTNRLDCPNPTFGTPLSDYCFYGWGSHTEQGNGSVNAPYYRDVGSLHDSEVNAPAESALVWEGLTCTANAGFARADANGVTRHSDGVNMAFLDGHVKWIKWLDDLNQIANSLVLQRNGVYVYKYLSPVH